MRPLLPMYDRVETCTGPRKYRDLRTGCAGAGIAYTARVPPVGGMSGLATARHPEQPGAGWGCIAKPLPHPAPAIGEAMSTPWFPMYAPDFLASTMTMAPEVVGAYVRLLCWSWLNGPIPGDTESLDRITGGLSERGWAEIRSRLVPHGDRDGDRDGDRSGDRVQAWVHPRMEQERERTNNITKARRDAAKATNERRKHGDRSGQRDGDRSGDRDGDRLYPQPQPQIQSPHPTGGGAGGGGVSKQGGAGRPAVSPAGGLGSAQARSPRPEVSTPPPAPTNAVEGNVAPIALREVTSDEAARITRWPGQKISPETIAGQKSVFLRLCRDKRISDDLIRQAWGEAIANWVAKGEPPYDYLRLFLLADWQNVRNADSIIRHRLGVQVVA